MAFSASPVWLSPVVLLAAAGLPGSAAERSASGRFAGGDRAAASARVGVRPHLAQTAPARRRSAAPQRRVVGCRAHGTAARRFGWRGRRVLALTFDDGPAALTPVIVGILERARVRATFFQIGRQVAGHGALERRILGDGDALGNHTFTHPDLRAVPGRVESELRSASAAIARASGYRPCVFRPPYGAYDRLVVARARALGLATVVWDVDPRDWSRPGAAAIRTTVLRHAVGGSIVLMHDGGGPRGQTVAALPAIIRGLRSHGYRFVTVPELLGFPPIYR